MSKKNKSNTDKKFKFPTRVYAVNLGTSKNPDLMHGDKLEDMLYQGQDPTLVAIYELVDTGKARLIQTVELE